MQKPISHAWIPDTQCKPDVPLDHLDAAGEYLLEKRPDVWILGGDHYDMPSCSNHKTPLEREGLRVQDDLEAGHEGLRRLDAATARYNKRRKKHNQYRPRKVVVVGNHEMQIERIGVNDPKLAGQYGLHSFRFKEHGYEVVPFLQTICIHGVWYSHYWANQLSGRPIGGNCHYKLSKLKFSFTMGHVQEFDFAVQHLQNGKRICGLVAGAFYQHDEDYKGPQGNHHWRGIVIKNEVFEGHYDLMQVSLNFLMRKYR